MHLVTSDLEGVFTPEIWINVAEKTGIEELRLTTRDISDYDVLMKKRLAILKEHKLTLADIQAVIAKMSPLDGASEFLDWIRSRTQLIIVSDTFSEFAGPLMEQLGWPTLLCHHLTVNGNGMVTDYNLRQPSGKMKVVRAMQSLKYNVIAMGDSYNDTEMLLAADKGVLFKPPRNVKEEFPQLPVAEDYEAAKQIISAAMGF
jgi:phosphoserine / homoserine phosphotransferase